MCVCVGVTVYVMCVGKDTKIMKPQCNIYIT